MEVDQNNFTKALELIETKLASCEFLSLHLLSTNRIEDKLERSFFEDHGSFYRACLKAIKNSPHDFQPIEIGLVIWRIDSDGDTTYQAFNFPIFPTPSTLLPMSKRAKYFTLDENVISSLLERDFKFNTWIKDSVSHLTIFESDLAKAKLEENLNEITEIRLEGEDKLFIEDMTIKMNEFLSCKDQTIFRFPSCNAWRRRLIYQTFKADPYSKSMFLQTCKQQKDVVIANKLSEVEVKRRMDEYFNKQIGFLAIFKLIIHCQKPVVGYNIFNDLLIYYRTFWTSPPEVLEEFKEIFRSLFPCIIDIQNMSQEAFDTESLEEIFLKLDTKYKNLSIAQQKSSDSKAFKIGCSFIKLLNHFHKIEHPDEKFDLTKSEKLIEPFKNKISLRNNYDLRTIDLCNEDPLPSRESLRFVKIIAEERFLDFEDWIKDNEHEIITRFNDSIFLLKMNKNIEINDDINSILEIMTVKDYFDEERRLEMKNGNLINQDEELEKGIEDNFENILLSNDYKSGEIKLPKDDDDDDDDEDVAIVCDLNQDKKDSLKKDEKSEKYELVEEDTKTIDHISRISTRRPLQDDDHKDEQVFKRKKSSKIDKSDILFEENPDWE